MDNAAGENWNGGINLHCKIEERWAAEARLPEEMGKWESPLCSSALCCCFLFAACTPMHSAGVSSAIQDLKKDKDGLGSKEKTCLDVLHQRVSRSYIRTAMLHWCKHPESLTQALQHWIQSGCFG